MNISETHIAGLIAWRLSPLLDVVRYQRLLERIADPAKLLDNPALAEEFPLFRQKLGLKAYQRDALETLKNWSSIGISVTVLGAADYPRALACIADPPYLITYRGRMSNDLSAMPAISIIGSRRADSEGIEIAQHFASELTKRGITIISGMALGIDGAAHRGAIQVARAQHQQPSTLAIVGNGLSQVYPRAHEQLAKEILESGGMLISQFDPKEPPYPVNFLNRNRLIAALSQATLVVQASEKSGSLVTAKYALEYGKELMIVPGSVKDPRYTGSNRLLQHGAHLVTKPADIFECLPDLKNIKPEAARKTELARTEHWITKLLSQSGPQEFFQLQNQAPNSAALHQELLELELAGIVERLPGNQIALTTTEALKS